MREMYAHTGFTNATGKNFNFFAVGLTGQQVEQPMNNCVRSLSPKYILKQIHIDWTLDVK